MKKLTLIICLLISITRISIAQIPNPRWMYVDNLANILGTPYETDLLNYISSNNITYIAAYQVNELITGAPCLLGNFINECHTRGTTVGAVVSSPCEVGASHVSIGSFWYDKYLELYNYNTMAFVPACGGSPWTLTNPKIDVMHFENEYWNMHPDDYNDMVTNLNNIISHKNTNSSNIEFQIHMARFPSGGSWPAVTTQAAYIADNFDVIQAVDYAATESKLLSQTKGVVQTLLDNTTKTQLDISILFSNLCNASGDWLRSNAWNHDLLYSTYYTTPLTSFYNAAYPCPSNYYGCHQSKLNLMPPIWFSYSFEFSFPDVMCGDLAHPNRPENSTSNLAKFFGNLEFTGGGYFRNKSRDRVVIQEYRSTPYTNLHQLTNPYQSYTFEAWVNIPNDVLSPLYASNNTLRTLFVNYSYYFEVTEDDIPIYLYHPINGFRIAIDNSNHLMVASPNFTDGSGNTFYMPPANYGPPYFIGSIDEIRVTDNNAIPVEECVRITVKVSYLSSPDRQVIDFYINGVHSSQKTVAVHLNGNAIGDYHLCFIGGDEFYYLTNPVTFTQYNNCNTTCNYPSTFYGLIDDVKIWDSPLDNAWIMAPQYQSLYNIPRDFLYWRASENLVSNWRFDERFQNRIAIDNSANGYHGYLSDYKPTYPFVPYFAEDVEPKGGITSCYAYETQVGGYFNGDKKLVELTNASSTNKLNIGTGEFFFEALINPEYTGNEQAIFSNRNVSGSSGFLWGLDANGRMFFQFGNNPATRITTDPLDPLNVASNIGFDIYDVDDYTSDQIPPILLSHPDIVLFGGCHHIGIERTIEAGVVSLRFYIDNMRSRPYRANTTYFPFVINDITTGAAMYLCGWDETSRALSLVDLSYKGMLDDVRFFNISEPTRWYNYQNYLSPGSYSGYSSDPGLLENEGFFMRRGERILDHYNAGSCAIDLNFEDYARDANRNYNGSQGNQVIFNSAYASNMNLLATAKLGNTAVVELAHDPLIAMSCSNVSSSVPELKAPKPKPELMAQSKGNGHIVAYPNPFSDVVTFQSIDPIITLEVFDVTGKKVFAQLDGNELHTADWIKGVYFISVTTTRRMTTNFKMIK